VKSTITDIVIAMEKNALCLYIQPVFRNNVRIRIAAGAIRLACLRRLKESTLILLGRILVWPTPAISCERRLHPA
jgi:hypothetical protein